MSKLQLALNSRRGRTRSWPRDDGRIAVRDVRVARPFELADHGLDRVPDHLDARSHTRIKGWIVRTAHRPARYLEDHRPAVAHGLAGLGIRPRSLARQRAVLRPQSLRQRHRADL